VAAEQVAVALAVVDQVVLAAHVVVYMMVVPMEAQEVLMLAADQM
jgi:hypothetical protein